MLGENSQLRQELVNRIRFETLVSDISACFVKPPVFLHEPFKEHILVETIFSALKKDRNMPSGANHKGP